MKLAKKSPMFRASEPAGACALAASAMRIPVVMWDGNVVPGRSVRWTARVARCLTVSFDATCRALGGRRPCFVTGTPIRKQGPMDRAAARVRLGLGPDERLLLIFGGSQAVRRFNLAVAEALPRLVEVVRVLHVTGDAGFDAAVAARSALPANLRDDLPAGDAVAEAMRRRLLE